MPRGGAGYRGRGRGTGARGGARSAPYKQRTPDQRVAAADASRRHAWHRVFQQAEEITQLYAAINGLSKLLDTNQQEWKIPEHHLNDFKKLLEGKENEYECPICMDSLAIGKLYFTPTCFHKFHAGCVQAQPPCSEDTNSRRCALCREEFIFRRPPVASAASRAATASGEVQPQAEPQTEPQAEPQ